MSVHIIYYKDGAKIKSALASEFNGFPMRLRKVLDILSLDGFYSKELRYQGISPTSIKLQENLPEFPDSLDKNISEDIRLPRMPQGIRESIDAVGPQLAMPVVTAICPCIGTLATGVSLDVHGTKRGLNGERQKRGKNDSIFERLDIQFTFEQAMQHSVAVKGANVNHNTVRQMLKNWRKQGLVFLTDDGRYRKSS